MRRLLAVLAVAVLVLAACSGSSGSKQASPTTARGITTTSSPSVATTTPGCTTSTTVGPGQTGKGDTAPPGDIPDTQAYVVFAAPSGSYSIKVPEGWARADTQDSVTFTDKYNGIKVQVVPAPAAPTVESVKSSELPGLAASVKCYAPGSVTSVSRKGGQAVLVTYKADSPADPVTGKAVRDDVERYEFWHAGSEAIVTLSAPTGSDNVDPWKLVTDSFVWK